MANTKVKAEQLEAAQTNITSLGTLTSLTVDDITINGSTISDGGDLTLDIGGDINIDADGGDINFKDGGTLFGQISNSSGLYLVSNVSDADIFIRGNDGGSYVNALTFDMSAAGAATFNSSVIAAGLLKASTNGSSAAELDIVSGATWTLRSNPTSGTNSYGLDIIKGSGGTDVKMTIDSSGDVGIGETTPFAKLHVKDTGWSGSSAPYGTVQLIEGKFVVDQNWGHLVITDEETGSGQGGSLRFATGPDSSLNPFAGIQGSAEGTAYGSLTFYTRPNGGTATERMRIRSDGNVGIGSVGMPVYSGYTQLSVGQMCHIMANTAEASSGSLNISTNAHFDADGSWETMVTGLASNYYQYNGSHYWRVAGSTSAGTDITWKEAMHLNSVGQLTIGNASHNDDVLYLTRGNTGKLLRFYHSGSEVGYIGTTSGTTSLPSDRNFKKDINDLNLGLDFVKSLNPKTFRLKIEENDSPLSTGLIAQEIEESLTKAGITKNSLGFLQHKPNEDAEQSQYWINNESIIPILINAIQELSAKLEAK